MLNREQIKQVAAALWNKAEEVDATGLLLGEWTRDGYVAEVLDAFDRMEESKLLPLDAAIAAVKRAESKGSIRYRVTVEPEWEGPEGFFESGDDEQDSETIAQIRRDMEWNEWAWCAVKVTCTIPGYDAEGNDYLGGCSYNSKEDFCQPGGYYDDMKSEARAAIISEIADEIVEERKRL